jgi:hypothetical protein
MNIPKEVIDVSLSCNIPLGDILAGLEDGSWVYCGCCGFPVAIEDTQEIDDMEYCAGCMEDDSSDYVMPWEMGDTF